MLKYSKFCGFILLCSCLCVFLMPQNAHANDIRNLTDDNISRFILESSKMMNGQTLEYSTSEIQEYLEKHLHEDARFKSTMNYNIPGYPSQGTSMSMKKEDFIKQIGEGSQAINEYENEISIDDIRISRDKTKATVRTTGFETGYMPVPDGAGNTRHMPIEGSSSCNQVLMLEDGVIQMYSAQCATSITFQEY